MTMGNQNPDDWMKWIDDKSMAPNAAAYWVLACALLGAVALAVAALAWWAA
jgi:hypothetical protein